MTWPRIELAIGVWRVFIYFVVVMLIFQSQMTNIIILASGVHHSDEILHYLLSDHPGNTPI